MKSEDLIWRTEYNIGDYKIDNEHQHLFAIARQVLHISELKDDKESKEALKKTFADLFAYVATHFEHEEAFMRKINYPDLVRHQKCHQHIVQVFTSVIEEAKYLTRKELVEKTINFIQTHVLDHILYEDTTIQTWQLSLDEIQKAYGWKDIYRIGCRDLDKEHKELFSIADEAFAIAETGQERIDKIRLVVHKLYEYLKEHFKHEEEYMRKVNYPGIEAHKQMHEHVIKDMNRFIKQAKGMNILLFEKCLARMIDVHLVQHIIQEDRKLLEFSEEY